MPRCMAQWAGLYVLGLLDRWIDSLRRSYFSHFFATQLLMYYDIVAYSVFRSTTTILRYIATYSV